jgi:hypothetical protein
MVVQVGIGRFGCGFSGGHALLRSVVQGVRLFERLFVI